MSVAPSQTGSGFASHAQSSSTLTKLGSLYSFSDSGRLARSCRRSKRFTEQSQLERRSQPYGTFLRVTRTLCGTLLLRQTEGVPSPFQTTGLCECGTYLPEIYWLL